MTFSIKANWNQVHWRIAIKLKLISLINQFPPHNLMWETLTFLQNYRAVTEIIFKLFKKETHFCIFWMSKSLLIIYWTFLYIIMEYIPHPKINILLIASLGFSGLFHKSLHVSQLEKFLNLFTLKNKKQCLYCLNVI